MDLMEELENLSPQLAKKFRENAEYGLVYEKHPTETVDLYHEKINIGDKVRIIPHLDNEKICKDVNVYTVEEIGEDSAIISLDGETQAVSLNHLTLTIPEDAHNVALKKTGEHVSNPDNTHIHKLIKSDNILALTALQEDYTGKIDAIYIDPPYNTGANHWKYPNNYRKASDKWKHSYFMNFLEKRLKLAKTLLNPSDSVLILTIDEKEYLNVGLLLKKVFPEARHSMISSVINHAGVTRKGSFSRTNEYLYVLQFGENTIEKLPLHDEWITSHNVKAGKESIAWAGLKRRGDNNYRHTAPGCFYPFYINEETCQIEKIGDPLPLEQDRTTVEEIEGCFTLFPLLNNDTVEGRWQYSPDNAQKLLDNGYIKVRKNKNGYRISYLPRGEQEKFEQGNFKLLGREEANNTIITDKSIKEKLVNPGTQWNITSHNASVYGTMLVKEMLGEKRFDYPKSLYAVEDILRFFVKSKKNATILDFFAGSGTTAHAVMRLNDEDGGKRISISITNNDVSNREADLLIRSGFTPRDSVWNSQGIYEHVTKPRILAGITGLRPDGSTIKEKYKHNKVKPMSEGLPENIEYYTIVRGEENEEV